MKPNTECANCGKKFHRYESAKKLHRRRFCSTDCYNELRGRIKTDQEIKSRYRLSKTNGSYTFDHRAIVEKALGKPLPPKCEIHHVNGNGLDNSPGNLVLCENHAYHYLLHSRAKTLAESGHADWKRCAGCGEYDAVENLRVYKRSAWHAECQKRNSRAYNVANREKIAARCRKYRDANREKISERARKYHADNREKRNAKNREYRANNSEELRMKDRERYRAKKAQAEVQV